MSHWLLVSVSETNLSVAGVMVSGSDLKSISTTAALRCALRAIVNDIILCMLVANFF